MKPITFRLIPSLFLLSFGYLISIQNTYAHFSFNEHNKKAFEEILKLKLTEGEKYLKKAKDARVSNGVDIYLENYIEIIRLVAIEDPKITKQYAKNEKIRLDLLSKMDQSSPYYLLTQAEIKLQWAILYYKIDKPLEAFVRVRKAYHLIKENDQKFPDFIPNKKTLGIYKILFSLIPEKLYPFLDIMGFDPNIANIQEGIADLNHVAGSNNPFALEATLLKEGIKSYIMHHHAEAHEALYALYQQNPDNHAYYTGALLTAINARMGKKALSMLEQPPSNYFYGNNSFFDYMKAKVNMQTGYYGRAIYHAKRYIEKTQREAYVKDSHLILFLSYWFLDQEDKAKPYLDRIKSVGNTRLSEDSYAQEFAQYKELPDKALTKARFLSDAGEYEAALGILQAKPRSAYHRPQDQAEHAYRMARVLHHQGRIGEAMKQYQQTISLASDLNRYFAPKAMLFLGHIYREKGDTEQARDWYKKVIAFKKTEYRTELEISAKAALRKLDNQ